MIGSIGGLRNAAKVAKGRCFPPTTGPEGKVDDEGEERAEEEDLARAAA